MENEGSNQILPTTSGDSWPLNDLPDLSSTTLNSVFASEPLASHSDFNNYLQSLGDHEDPLLNPATVASINDILVSDEGVNQEGSQGVRKADQSFDLGHDGLPSSLGFAHGQSKQRDASSSRPGHGVQGVLSKNETGLSDAVLNDIERMQANVDPLQDKAPAKKYAIKEGLQKIKEQLDKSDKSITGPAVVTEFIDNTEIMFSEDIDETSKCSVDSAELLPVKEITISPRRSARKTTRLFDIVGPKTRKSGNEKPEEVENTHNLRSEGKEVNKSPKETNKKDSEAKKEAPLSSDDAPKRRSLRGQHKEEDDKQSKSRNEKSKAGSKGSKSESEGEVKKIQGQKRGKGRTKVKSEDESEEEGDKNVKKGSKLDASKDKSQRKKPGRRSKKEIEEEEKRRKKRDAKDAKNPKKKGADVKTKKEETEKGGRKEDNKEEENTEDDGEDSSDSDESVLDDGEISDDCSDFDPDDDPDRPWCICRKPHGNRFMICCDTCEDWFHGDCVGITMSDGREMEKHGEEWMCPKCKKKLQALSKELREKERLERLKNRWKSEEDKSSSDEKDGSSSVRKKLLQILQKETSVKHEVKAHEPKERKKFYKDVQDEDQSSPVKKKARSTAEDKESREARKIEEENEWKRQLKEMKARQAKAEMEIKRRESLEGHITFEKIGAQKIVQFKTDGKPDVKQESVFKKDKGLLKSAHDKEGMKDRRKSDSSAGDRKRSEDRSTRRISFDLPKERQLKRELSEESEDSPKKQRSSDGSISKKVRITPTPKTLKPPNQQKYCIVCNRPAMKNAVYCNKDCITSHTKESLRLIAEDKLKRLGIKTSDVKSPTHTESGKGTTISPATSSTDVADKSDERITVLERSSGKVLAGLMAPTRANIFSWVEEHPTFEVFRPANASNTSSKEKKDLTEVIRNNVKKSLKETILTRCREYDMEVNIEDVTKLCHTIEEEIVKMFGDTGQKYKTKYRSLIFNLKDPKNRNLYKQVVLGDLSPSKLVHMTPEQLASAELARWREKEAKHNIEMIKKREEEEATMGKPAVKKTHKGEVELETEADDMRNLETHIELPEENKEPTADEANAGVSFEDTTNQHTTHLFDLNCKICTGKQLPPGQQPILPHVSTSVIQAIPESSMPSPTDSPDEVDLKQNSPDVIESLNRSPIHIPLPSKEQLESVWKGFVMMQSVAKFASCAYRVSGACEKLLQVLPDTIHVCGRITPEQVWDYLFQLKGSNSKIIDVLRFEMAAEEEKAGYVSLYSYFYTRKRIGVVGNCYSGVKDMYLVPLASHDPIPPELKPFEGPGMPDPRPHMLIGIIVRNKPASAPQKRSKSGHHSNTPEPVTKKSKKHSKDRSKKEEKKHSKKTLESPYEDIVFGKHKPVVPEGKTTPSESSSSYTPDTLTPSVSTAPSVSLDGKKELEDDAKLKLEEKLEKQKEELLRLQAEIHAKMRENKAADMLPAVLSNVIAPIVNKSTDMAADLAQNQASSYSATMPIDTSSSAALEASAAPTLAASMSVSTAASVTQTQVTSLQGMPPAQSMPPVQSIPPVQSMQGVTPIQGMPPVQAAVGQQMSYPAISSPFSASSMANPSQIPVQAATSVASALVKPDAFQAANVPLTTGPSAMPQTDSIPPQLSAPQQNLGTSIQPAYTPQSVVAPAEIPNPVSQTDKPSADDEPYDPEDAIETEIGEPNSVTKEPEPVKPSSGDEPYDPEDDFVLDLIEDISLPAALKKIDKPNLPFPLEITKKPDNKMPELPPIRLPDKQSDRRGTSFASFTSSTLVDPRSNSSPRTQPVATQGGSAVESPTFRAQSQLSSPASIGGHANNWSSYPRHAEGVNTSSLSSNKDQDEAGTPKQKESSEYWKTDQQYGSYSNESDPRGQTAAGQSQDGYYQNRYDSYSTGYHDAQSRSYQGHAGQEKWQGSYSGDQGHAGQRSGHDSNWKDRYRYDNTYDRSGSGGDWTGRERDHESWQRGYQSGQYDYKNDNKYRGDNYRRDHGDNAQPDRSWNDHRESSGYYRGQSQDRGRGNQWR